MSCPSLGGPMSPCPCPSPGHDNSLEPGLKNSSPQLPRLAQARRGCFSVSCWVPLLLHEPVQLVWGTMLPAAASRSRLDGE